MSVRVKAGCSSDGHLSIDVSRRVVLLNPYYGIFSIKMVYVPHTPEVISDVIQIIILFLDYIILYKTIIFVLLSD